MPTEIILAKGSNTVTIYSSQIVDSFTNKIFKITPAKGKQGQDAGPNDVKVVDLLRLTRTFRVDGYLTTNGEKGTLISIIEGGGVKGGGITLTYSGGGDSTSFTVFVESCVFTQKSADEPTSAPDDFAKHQLAITIVKGSVV